MQNGFPKQRKNGLRRSSREVGSGESQVKTTKESSDSSRGARLPTRRGAPLPTRRRRRRRRRARNNNPALDTFEEKMGMRDTIGPGDCEEDPEVHMANQHVSAICPLSQTRLRIPCRSYSCKHAQCFDLEVFIGINQSVPERKWTCPICNVLVKTSTQLYVDRSLMATLIDNPSVEEFKLSHNNQAWIPLHKNCSEAVDLTKIDLTIPRIDLTDSCIDLTVSSSGLLDRPDEIIDLTAD